jgi:uncharacterized protein (TIGR00369 family)
MPHKHRARRGRLAKTRRALSGLAFFRKMMAGDVPRAPMTALLDFRLLEADEGRVVFGAVPTRSHYNGMGVVHGGLVAALLDSALGCAINTLAPPGRVFTTLEIKINYTRPLTGEVGPLRCEARAIHVGSRVGTAEGRVIDANGKLYAHGTTTCILVEPGRNDNGSRRSRGSRASRPGTR